MKIRFAQIEPTTRCNYTCGFCVGRHMPQQDLPLETFRRFIDSVEGLEAIELQGEGEPLLHPDFFDMIRLARARFPGLEISMITNGSMFTTEHIRQILECDIARIYVSVESVNDADFKRIRGGKLERVRRGVRQLLAARKESGLSRPLLGLSVTVLRSTAPELYEHIPAFYRELGMDGGINIQPLQSMSQYVDIYDDETRGELLDAPAVHQVRAAQSGSPALREVLQDHSDNRDTGFYERLYGSVDSRIYCPWLQNGIYMATNGNLVACCHMKDYDGQNLGNIGDDLGRVEAGRRTLQKTLNAGQMPEGCRNCSVASAVVRNSRMIRRSLAQGRKI